ncbi:MAG TPA: sigma-70 family RNA polymerase sigma factor [Actinomycetota bacterium]|nr:sigma-70 family RNA polymerase sigma factor [Actinomycetota bacterium]
MGTDAAVAVTEEGGRLERLYVRHVPRVTRIAFLLVGDAEAARDLAHEAYLRTSRRLHTLRNPDAFGAYMTRTAINLSKRHRVRRERERRYVERASGELRTETVPPDVATQDELVRALRELPQRQRAALVLRFYADLPDADIAEALGSPVGTVRSLISRGLAALRKQLGDEHA